MFCRYPKGYVESIVKAFEPSSVAIILVALSCVIIFLAITHVLLPVWQSAIRITLMSKGIPGLFPLSKWKFPS